MIRAAIFGCAGPQLSAAEAAFFHEADPLGFVLFQRNCQTPDQVRVLTNALRETVGRPDAPILIDQEGGRVARLRPPVWRAVPAAARIGSLADRGADAAAEGARLNAQLLAAELVDLGITVNCAPVLDLRMPDAHDVIGDRAFGTDPELVATLGRATCEGFLAAGVIPVIKHMPGHGRAIVDSHLELPRVSSPLSELRKTDFLPFRRLNDMPWGITAHVVYTAIDGERPATISPVVIDRIIRGEIGFNGVIVSDDLSMEALRGSVNSRAAAAVAAGCDLVLHCNGRREEMQAVADAVPPISTATVERLQRVTDKLPQRQSFDLATMRARLDALLLAS